MSEYLYRLRPKRIEMITVGPTEEESSILAQHFAYLEKLVAENVVHIAGPTLNRDARTFGIVIFTAPSEEWAGEIMQGDPAVQQGIMTAELFPFRVSLWSKKGPPGQPNEP